MLPIMNYLIEGGDPMMDVPQAEAPNMQPVPVQMAPATPQYAAATAAPVPAQQPPVQQQAPAPQQQPQQTQMMQQQPPAQPTQPNPNIPPAKNQYSLVDVRGPQAVPINNHVRSNNLIGGYVQEKWRNFIGQGGPTEYLVKDRFGNDLVYNKVNNTLMSANDYVKHYNLNNDELMHFRNAQSALRGNVSFTDRLGYGINNMANWAANNRLPALGLLGAGTYLAAKNKDRIAELLNRRRQQQYG